MEDELVRRNRLKRQAAQRKALADAKWQARMDPIGYAEQVAEAARQVEAVRAQIASGGAVPLAGARSSRINGLARGTAPDRGTAAGS